MKLSRWIVYSIVITEINEQIKDVEWLVSDNCLNWSSLAMIFVQLRRAFRPKQT